MSFFVSGTDSIVRSDGEGTAAACASAVRRYKIMCETKPQAFGSKGRIVPFTLQLFPQEKKCSYTLNLNMDIAYISYCLKLLTKRQN